MLLNKITWTNKFCMPKEKNKFNKAKMWHPLYQINPQRNFCATTVFLKHSYVFYVNIRNMQNVPLIVSTGTMLKNSIPVNIINQYSVQY